MDFYNILEEVMEGQAYNPYAGKNSDGEWMEGTISIDFLNTHFGQFDTATPMIEKAESYNLEATVLYFEYLVEKGLLDM